MGTYKNTGALWEYYLIYLRKSRKDDPNETVEEVLSKHERDLQELAVREFGGRIPEENIYREIGSSESIEGRSEFQKVLTRIEDSNIRGVLVVDTARLGRGDLEECGQIVNAFRFTHTLVVTLRDTFDLNIKRDRRYFQDELLRGSDYQDYVKDVLQRGRENAVKRGCFIMQNAPYGYDKVKIGKDHTLEPNGNADVVRMIFEWYAEGLSLYNIAQKLNGMGIPAAKGGKWQGEVISRMVRNKHYAGKVVYNSRPNITVIENGERKKRRLKAAEEDCIIAEGKHPAIIDPELWDRAQERIRNTPRTRSDKKLTNVLAGLLRCSSCGYVMDRRALPSGARYFCPTHGKRKQCFKTVKCDVLLSALRIALEEAELPALRSKVDNDEGNARKAQERIIAKLQKQMDEYRDQEETQYELLETKKYTQEVFDRRNAQLRAKMEDCQKQLHLARSVMPKSVNYAERVVALEEAISALHDPEASTDEVNKVLKAIIERIEFTGSPSLGFHGPRGSDEFKLEVFLRL